MSYKILLVIFFIMRLSYYSIVLGIIASIYLAEAQATPLADLKTGLAAIKAQNIVNAIIIYNKLPKNSFEAKLMLWALATSEPKTAPSQLIKLAINELPNWPAQNKIECNLEKAWYRELSQQAYTPSIKLTNGQANDILKFFKEKTPLTAEGMAILGASAIYKHQSESVSSKLANYWYTVPLSPQAQNIILSEAGKLLSSIDHLKRLRMLLLTRHFESANQLAPLAYAVPITKAFIAAAKNDKNAFAMLQKIQKKWQTNTLYQYAYIEYLRHDRNYQLAATRLSHLTQTNEFLVCPNSWWRLRMSLSYELLDEGHAELAYSLINKPHIKNPYYAAEQEFRAGWLCLRFLNKPILAIKHFAQIFKYTKNKTYQAKAYYWLSRSYERLNKPALAKNYYKNSAKFNTNYYGQLSAVALGQTNLELSKAKSQIKVKLPKFEEQVLTKLSKIGATEYTRLWAINLANKLTSKEELILLISKMREAKDYYTALKIAKIAQSRDIDIGTLTHITGAIPDELKLKPADKALAYAVARQESEFNTKAISTAGAIGLMQLVPKTAKELANKFGKKFSNKKLSNNPAYNTQLGLKFLQKQLANFNNSYLLTFTAYNAGPHRTTQWIKHYGDPRKMSLHNIIDWVERIPYPETRNYVMRVLENYEIYRIIFIGKMNLISDLKGNPAS